MIVKAMTILGTFNQLIDPLVIEIRIIMIRGKFH